MYEEFEGNHTPYIASMKVSENTQVSLRLQNKAWRKVALQMHVDVATSGVDNS